MTKYTVRVRYVVCDYVEIELPDDQNENDAIEQAEEISWKRPSGDMCWDLCDSEIIGRK